MVQVCGVARVYQMQYCTHTHATHSVGTTGLPVPMRNPIPCWIHFILRPSQMSKALALWTWRWFSRISPIYWCSRALCSRPVASFTDAFHLFCTGWGAEVLVDRVEVNFNISTSPQWNIETLNSTAQSQAWHQWLWQQAEKLHNVSVIWHESFHWL